VEVACAKGWQACGVEPSAWAAKLAQNRGLHVVHGTQDAAELQGKKFDVITMWDVIEHVPDPSAEMAKAFQMLKPGGWLVLHTMNIDSLTARLMGSRWPWLMDMHIHYFSQKTMTHMLKNNGFQVVSAGAHGRYLRLNFIANRLHAFHKILGKAASKVIYGLKLEKKAIPINFGDLFTVYAQRP
jgi:cyclopropane fatty-acyl-phospholipid synthase-like methyltransferase